MSEKLYEALEICLHALETGADLGSVLRLFPDLEQDLRPLLETSRQASLLAIPEVPEAALQRGKARVLQHAAGMRERYVSPRNPWAVFAFPRLAVSLAIALLFLFSGTGLVRASAGALPGDNLYPVKRTWEDLRLLFIFNPEGREQLENEFEEERLHEIDELLAEGRHETIAFSGVVMEQNGDLWVVSGVTVRITPESRLPGAPVNVGASVSLQGWTDAQGYVEAEWVELVEPGELLPASEPDEKGSPEENSNGGDADPQENENEQPDEEESGSSPKEEEDEGSGNDSGNDNSNEHDGNDNSGGEENDNGEDHKEENDNDEGGGEQGEGENSGSGEGENESEGND